MEQDDTTLLLPPSVEKIIPFDKSWLMRLGVLDLLLDNPDTEAFLFEHRDNLSTDLQALAHASQQWRDGTDIDVGESGTLFRFLQFAAWKNDEDRTFIKKGTLSTRQITSDPSIVELNLSELLKLDNGTSQWASAAVLLGNTELPNEPMPFKLQLTYDAVKHWIQKRKQGETWEARVDNTIGRQVAAFLRWQQTGDMAFTPEQAEDYCFARAFGLITPAEGEARWPSLRQHESDRIASMEQSLEQDVVNSDDHRVVQAVAFLKGNTVTYLNPTAVRKSFPLFWELIEETA